MRNEFYLEDNDQDPDLFEHTPKSRRWRPSWTFLLIILLIAGGSAITYFMTQPTSHSLTAQATPNPQPEATKEPIADQSSQTEPSEPAVVEPYRGDQAGFPELIAQTPIDTSNVNKETQQAKEQNTNQSMTVPDKQKMPDTSKQKNPLSKENKLEQTAMNPVKQKISNTQGDPAKGNKGKQKAGNPEKQTVSPTQKHQANPAKKPPIKQTFTTPEKQQVSATHTQKTLTPQTNIQPNIMQQMLSDDQSQPAIIEKEASPSKNATDKSVQWIVPSNPEENPSNQPKNTFQLEPYLLNQEGKILPLLSTKATEPKDPLKSNLIPLIQIESPTRLDVFFLQIQSIQEFITQTASPEIHIRLIEQNEQLGTTEAKNNIPTILTSLIHQSTQQTNKKLILHKPTTQSKPSYFPLLEHVDGLQFSTKVEPITTIGKKLNLITTPPLVKTIQSWSVKQAFNIQNEQLPNLNE
ncbi:hypothetical protein J2Z48_001793 [Croceifilum oryzae]|uniref:Uncharacterized protein n=1 Tax=Croceifilum oryzae TaxID=1553429 RepID=A0AAJ1TEU4_9BACL|nr:hypothetical protein [Croceifilum oryzae]MDQ0417620.1 hypothetical protein [Croceifilum oryzae]